MTTIWKFPLEAIDRQIVRVPKGARALTAQMQGGQLCIWALVDTKNVDTGVGMPVYIHGTGHEVRLLAAFGRYLSTVQMDNGALVFHVFVGEGF
jgi:hypothetical protein